MAEAKKEWIGIRVNFNIFQGKILNDPQESGGYYFMTLRSQYTSKDANGNFKEVEQDIPIMVEPDGPATNVVKNGYIKAGRKLMAWCHYMTWTDDNGVLQHMFVSRRFDLGDKPYETPAT